MMNEQELFLSTGKSAQVYFCGKCRRVSKNQYDAKKCCEPEICNCGQPLERYWTACESCRNKKSAEREKARFDKAETISSSEYDGFVYDPSGAGIQDGYFESLGSCIEEYENDYEDGTPAIPEYVYCCSPDIQKLDIHYAIELLCEDGYEDMEDRLTINDSLIDAANEFNKINEQALTLWGVDYSRKIIINPPIKGD